MNIEVGDIHLWTSKNETINDPNLISQYHILLNEEERVRYKSFRFEKHRHQYLITRAMVRSVMSLYVNSIPPSKWKFKTNGFGKPYVYNKEISLPIQFNISHTENLIVLAVTIDQEIGVDVESVTRFDDIISNANSFFSPIEVSQLFALPLELQVNRCLGLWTLKEAYVKACGMGLSIPLNHFFYTFCSRGEISIDFKPERSDQSDAWHFWVAVPGKGYRIAIALKDNTMNKYFNVSTREIIPLAEIRDIDYPVGSILI